MYRKVFTLMMGLVMAAGLSAQTGQNPQAGKKNVTFAASDVQVWTGTGSNSALVAISWDDATAYVWGVRWSGSIVALNLFDTIEAYDPRFSHGGLAGSAWLGAAYVDTVNHLNFPNEGWWCYWVNSTMAPSGYGTQAIANGDFVEISANCTNSATRAVAAPALPSNEPEVQVTDATIADSAILWWAGSGANKAIVAVNWADTCLAWGVNFATDSISLMGAMNIIAGVDPRFAYTSSPSQYGELLSDITFVMPTDTLRLTEGEYWTFNVNGTMSMVSFDAAMLHDGDFAKWGDPTVDTVLARDEYGYPSHVAWLMPVNPVSAPSDATIAASSMQWWAGSGEGQVLVAVNWADSCLAWGVRFDGDSITLKAAMDSIAAFDPSFSYASSPSPYGGEMLGNIYYLAGPADTLRLTEGEYWMFNVNGAMSMVTFDAAVLHDGDFAKWGDPSVAIVTDRDEYGYPSGLVWTMPVVPAAAPQQPSGVEQVATLSLTVCPNPAADYVRCSVEQAEAASLAVELFDMTGRVALRTEAHDGVATLRVADLPAGLYLVRAGRATARVVVKH